MATYHILLGAVNVLGFMCFYGNTQRQNDSLAVRPTT